MSQIKLLLGLLCCIATVLLVACTKDMLAYEQKPMQLKSSMVLAETKQWNPLDGNRFWLFSFASQPYFNNYINATIPTYAAFEKNPIQWQRLQGSVLKGWSRIVGVVPAGTSFRIIDITPASGSIRYWVTIRFDGGPYNGETALYGNPRNILPELFR